VVCPVSRNAESHKGDSCRKSTRKQGFNKGLRPHLTRWQARFRQWYGEALKKSPDKSPQEIQRDFPQYRELVEDLIRVNKQLVEYANFIKQIAQGQGAK